MAAPCRCALAPPRPGTAAPLHRCTPAPLRPGATARTSDKAAGLPSIPAPLVVPEAADAAAISFRMSALLSSWAVDGTGVQEARPLWAAIG